MKQGMKNFLSCIFSRARKTPEDPLPYVFPRLVSASDSVYHWEKKTCTLKNIYLCSRNTKQYSPLNDYSIHRSSLLT